MNDTLFYNLIILFIGILIIYLINNYPTIVLEKKSKPDNYDNVYIKSYKF